jgi:hypothetical protein
MLRSPRPVRTERSMTSTLASARSWHPTEPVLTKRFPFERSRRHRQFRVRVGDDSDSLHEDDSRADSALAVQRACALRLRLDAGPSRLASMRKLAL